MNHNQTIRFAPCGCRTLVPRAAYGTRYVPERLFKTINNSYCDIGAVMAQEYPASFDAVSEKRDAFGFASLTEKEQATYTIWRLEAEVNNGGFHQYFWNSAGDHAAIALKSLNCIGANKTASLLQKAIDIAFNGKLPESRIERQKQLEIHKDSEIDKLGELDSKFYEHSENFYKMLDAYVAQ